MIGSCSEYLMVEDNFDDVQIFLHDFKENGIANKFHIAKNVDDAMKYLFMEDGSLRVEPPKVIFLDLYMPKISGLEFLHRIKVDEKTKKIPVVVLEASISPSDVNECQRLGVNDFIAKPLECESLISIIKKFH
jgi:CheY-like chemotaxis protein